MYKTIDENEEQKKSNDLAGKIKFDDLGLKQTNDFAQFATETIKNEMPEKYESWKSKGSIGVLEAGKMFADEFDGSYDNVLTIEQQKQNYRDKHPVIGEERSNKVDERIAKNKRAREERQKRINEGSASLYDKIVNKLDQFGDNSYKAQVDAAKQNEQLQKPHEGNPNYRYEAKGADLSGRVIYNEVDLRKKIGFAEGLYDSIGSGEALPFVAGFVSGSKNDTIEKIKNKINNGEEITQQELDRFNKHIERVYEKQVRGYTVGGEIGASWMPSMLAFGSEMFLGGAILKGVGLAGKGLSVGSKLTKTLGGGKAAKITGDITGHLLEGGVAAGVTSAVNPARLYATYKERRLNDTMKITDRGTVIFTDAKESPAKAFFKSLQQVYISYFTENMGALIGMPVRGVLSTGAKQFAKVLEHNPMLKKVVQKTSPVFEKLNKDFLKGEPAQWLKSQVKFDGFLEELGEEVLEDVLNLTFNTNYEERSLENYVNAIFKSPEEWAVLTGTIALQGTTLSLAGNLIADTMQRNGTDFKEIKNVIDTSTEDEKAEIIDSLKDAGFLKINPDAIDVKLSDSLKEERKQKFIKDGMSESNADFSASIENDMLNRISQKTGIDIDEIYSKEVPTIHTNDYELSVDDNGNRYIDDEIPQKDLDYYQDLAEREEYNQVEIAGAEENEISDAKKEWKEKGTDSKYFKKWFGDSKVVDKDGKPNLLTDDKEIYITDGYSNNGISRYSYKGSHRSPSYSGGDVQERLENSEDVNLFEVAQGYHNQPDDYFSPMGARYYMYDDKEGLESARAVKDVIAKIKNGKENITVKIYRVVPADVVSDKLKNGDWVTLSKSYAIEHGEQNLDGEYKIIEKEVPINEVWWDGNDIREWGYDNGKEQEADLYLKIENPKYQDVLPANWKEARELRNQGYDGIITPKGEYLVFEKTQIKSVDNRGTFDETNPNIYYQTKNNIKVKPVEIELDSVPNFKKVSDLKKWIGDNLNLLGDVQIKNNSRTVHFSKSNIGRSMKGINRSSTKRNSYAGLKELVENSVYSYTKEVDKRHSKRNNGQEIYHNAFIYNGEVYGIEISIDIPKNTNTTHSYAGHKIEIIKKAPEVNGTKLPDLTGANISINDIRGLFNPKVKILYQSAYHGSAEDFDIFDLSYALSGEGAMAHGYGVYTAKNKEVSESYRKTLAQSLKNAKYDGVLLSKTELTKLHHAISEKLYLKGKDEALKELELLRKQSKKNKDKEGFLGRSSREFLENYNEQLELLNSVDESKITGVNKGQLYKVDIPEDDVLLDKDKLLGDMILKEGLIDKLLDWANENGLYYQIDLTKSGAEIYDAIANKLGSDKLASEKLNELGFKGIKYNGREDGECYVIFDDKAIQILKTYYQSANGGDNIAKSKEKYLNSKQSALKNFYDIHRNFTEKEPEQYTGKKTIKNVLEYLGSKDNKKAEIKTPIENVTITRNDVKHLLEDNEKERSNNINKIVETLKKPNLVITVDSQENKKNYYLKTFNLKDKKTAHLQVIKCCKDGNFYVTNFHLKNGKLNQLLKNGQIVYDLSDKSAVQNAPDNNIITDNSRNFNPKTYKQEIQPSLFEGNNKAREIHKVKGSFMPAEKIIELFKNADISTIIHEYAHWYLSVMERYANVSAEITEDLNEVRKFVKNSGEEFTQEQHEKFARGFEAYIRSGNARSNRLKKIYEDLKNALLQIYDEITKIIYTENGIDKPFTEEDLPQIKGLFDRLLTTENERIQRTVFDKVDEFDEKIKEIKENQIKEEQELDELYKNNLSSINRKSDKKRKVEEYLELAEKSTKKVPKAMKEFEKRYKDVTLNILSMVSGKDKKWVANKRNWEKLRDIIENVSDEITVNGADPSWAEFYDITGSTYDTEELGADYKLTSQAYDTLTSNDYSFGSMVNDPSVDLNIDNFYSMLYFLKKKVNELQGEENENAYEAMCELFMNMPQMPDALVSEVAEIVNSVEQDKNDEQKEAFNKKTYPNIPVVQQLQMYVTNKLNNLKVYNADKRYSTRLDRSHNLYKSIKNATSVNRTKKIIRKINDYVIEDLRNKQRRILHKEIQKQIKINSKLVKTGSVQKGKFDWRTNTVFAELTDLNKLSREDAEKMYLTLIKADDALLGEERENWSDNIVESMNIDKTDFQQLLKVKFLEYRSQYISKLDVLHTRSVLEDIMALKFEGRRAKSEEDLKKKLNKYDYENNLIDILQKHKDNKIAKTLAKWIMHSQTLSNWESLLNGIFDANTAEKYSLQQMEVSTDVYAREHFLSFLKRASEIYGFKKASAIEKALDFDNIQPLADLFRKYDNELYDYKETTFNKETGKYVETQRKLSKSQIMTIFTWSLNEELEQRLYTQFGLEQISDMFSRLSDEDMQLCFALIDCCDSMYEDTNEVFIRTLGISLPKVENYFPSKTERVGSDLDLFHDFMMKSSNPSFIKQRKSCNRIKMDPQSPLKILLPHINKTAKYVVMSEQLNFYNKIFASADVKAKIRDVFGEKDGDKLHRALLNQLAASTFSTYARGSAMTSDLLEHFNISTNYITSSIGGSGKVTIGQLLSVINYAENMPSGEWAKGFAKACANPVKTYKYMMDNCKYLQSRLAGNSQNEILQTLTSLKDPFRKLKNFCTLNVRWGDIIAITIGGKPYVDYLISTGMTKEEAFDKFVDDTLRAQQAGLNSTTSEWQKNNAKNFLGRMFFAFRNTDIQYERKFIDSIIKASKGDITKKQLVKTIMIYKVLNPVMFTSFLQNMSLVYLFNALFGFGDGGDDKEKAVGKTVMDIIMALGVAGTNAYGMGGFCVNAVIQAIYAGINRLIFDDSDYKIFGSSVPVLSDFEKIGRDLFAKGEIGFDDVLDAFCVGADLATGAPVKKVKNMALGMGDVARGEFGIGFSRMLGWGEYVSTKAWTGKAPKKKKKKRKLDY